MPLQPPKPDYVPPSGKAQLFSYHAPAGAYSYVIAFAEQHGVTRNRALTMIIEEHADAAEKAAARKNGKRPR